MPLDRVMAVLKVNSGHGPNLQHALAYHGLRNHPFRRFSNHPFKNLTTGLEVSMYCRVLIFACAKTNIRCNGINYAKHIHATSALWVRKLLLVRLK